MKLNFLVFLSLCLLLLSETTQAVQLRVVANVNGSMISSLDLENKVKPILFQKGLQKKSAAESEEVAKIYKETLDKMVQEKLIISQANRDGLNLKPEFIENQYQAIVKRSGLSEDEFLKSVAKQGVTKSYILSEIEIGAITKAIIEKNFKEEEFTVTDEQIKAHFEKTKSKYAQKTGICNLSMIIYPDAKTAQSYNKRIAAGQISFRDAAKRVTVGPNKEGGGSLGSMHVKDLAPAIQHAIAPITKGATPLLPMGDTFGQVYVNSCQVQKTSSIKMTDEIKESIRSTLQEPLYDKVLAEYAKELNKKAIIDIRY